MNDSSTESAAPISNGSSTGGETWDVSGGVVRRRGLAPVSVVFLLGLAILSLYNSLGPRELPGQRQGYGALILGLAVALLIRGRKVRLGKKARTALTLTVLWLAVGLVGVMTQDAVYPLYVFGDVASLSFPILFFLAGKAEPGLFRSARVYRTIFVILLAAAFVAVGFPDRSGRFEPPSTFLVAMVCVFGLLGRRGGARVAAGALLAVLFSVAFASEVRTAPILIILALAFTLALAGTSPRGLMAIAMILGGIAVAAQSSTAVRRMEVFLMETRFRRIVAGEVDESLLTRFLEGQDVARTAQLEWTPLNILVGSGHGATYQPHQSLVERNLTREGRVHNIHIGPALIGFRYGALGLVILCMIGVMVVRSLLRLQWNLKARDGPVILHTLFTIAMSLYLIDFALRNVITDPLFSYSLAGFLLTRPDYTAPVGPTTAEMNTE